MALRSILRRAKTVPRRDAIVAQLARAAVLFETFKRALQTMIELRIRNILQLRLGIVNVINVDCGDAEIFQRLIELVFEVSGRHAMTTADEVVERGDAGLDEGFVDILVGIARRRAVERQVAALRADHQLVAREAVLGGEYL